ncbi:DNA polymerase III, subunit gamma and tau, partial [Ancylostoma ceylanicum]
MSEQFIVSARKYRPQTFDTVVGQKSVTSTLRNAIKNNQLAQAFLFCGSRGVGKTTTARILAKTINCFNRTEEIEACDQCESCKSFNEGASLNVYELDAASNNSVDDIRTLIDQVRIAPQLGTHKVYIIDEVHIRIKVKDIADHLASIAVKESITADPEALFQIAQKADGALRDALSIFDQIVTFAGSNITYQSVIDNLNLLDYDYYFRIVDFAQKEDIPNCLLLFNEIMEKGFDAHNFIVGLSSHYRNLLVCKDVRTANLLE